MASISTVAQIEYQRVYRETHKDYFKLWRVEHPGYMKKKCAIWVKKFPYRLKHYRDTHKQEISDSNKVYYTKNKSKFNDHAKKYRLSHIEYLREYNKEYNINNKEKVKKRKCEYYINHREEILARKKDYRNSKLKISSIKTEMVRQYEKGI